MTMIRTVNDLQEYTSGVIKDTVEDMTGTIYADVFNRLNTDGFLDAMDGLLTSLYGTRDLREKLATDAATVTLAKMQIQSYLFSRAEYFKKIFLYIDAEYNPVENYNGTESEMSTHTYGSVNTYGMDTKGQDTYQHGAHTDTHTEGADGGWNVTTHIAKTKTTSTPPTDTDTLETAPFESETFYNKEKRTLSHTQGTETIERMTTGDDGGNDKVSYTQKKNKDEYVQYNDIAHVGGTNDSFSHTTGEHTDSFSRSFLRHGNIGVLSSGELLEKDSRFWREFGWLRDTAHDVANIISSGVWAL